MGRNPVDRRALLRQALEKITATLKDLEETTKVLRCLLPVLGDSHDIDGGPSLRKELPPDERQLAAEAMAIMESSVVRKEVAIVHWDRETDSGTAAQLKSLAEQIRRQKKELDIFLDDDSNEFILEGEITHLAGERRRLLVLLLLRVGKFWTCSQIGHLMGWREEKYQNNLSVALTRLHKDTNQVLKKYVERPRGSGRVYVSETLKKQVRYAAVIEVARYGPSFALRV